MNVWRESQVTVLAGEHDRWNSMPPQGELHLTMEDESVRLRIRHYFPQLPEAFQLLLVAAYWQRWAPIRLNQAGRSRLLPSRCPELRTGTQRLLSKFKWLIDQLQKTSRHFLTAAEWEMIEQEYLHIPTLNADKMGVRTLASNTRTGTQANHA